MDDSERIREDPLDAYLRGKRFDKSSHLGLGDIRLTIGEQEELVESEAAKFRALEQDNVRLATENAELRAVIAAMRSAIGLTVAKLNQLLDKAQNAQKGQ